MGLNIYYLKKFRKKAFNNYKLVKTYNNMYYVARYFDDSLYLSKTGNLTYKEAVKQLKEIRRNAVLLEVQNIRYSRERVIKNV